MIFEKEDRLLDNENKLKGEDELITNIEQEIKAME